MFDLSAGEAVVLGLAVGLLLSGLWDWMKGMRLLWRYRRQTAQIVHQQLPVLRVQRRVLAFYDDGSGLWGVGASEEEAIAKALAYWRSFEPVEGYDISGDFIVYWKYFPAEGE